MDIIYIYIYIYIYTRVALCISMHRLMLVCCWVCFEPQLVWPGFGLGRVKLALVWDGLGLTWPGSGLVCFYVGLVWGGLGLS